MISNLTDFIKIPLIQCSEADKFSSDLQTLFNRNMNIYIFFPHHSINIMFSGEQHRLKCRELLVVKALRR